ncbi:hypothetical protein FRO07_25575, partial [Escherichia coli]|nr:hypothetical protein [Escherichia coli]EFO2447499.1 hypothetical protein [Escherichia coli]
MCNALTVTKRKSAPLPERLCEQVAYCAILLTVYEADYSVVVVQSEGADHCYHSKPEMQNISLQNAVGQAVWKAKNTAGGATDAIFSGCQVLINLMSDFVLDKTKATAEGRQWESYILERTTNNATFAAGGQCVSFAPMTLDLTEGHYGEYAGLLVGYSCSLTSPCRDVFQVCGPNFVRLYSFRNVSRTNAHGANLSDSCSRVIFLRRLFRVGDGIFVNFLLFIMASCIAMRRSSSHHGAGDGYSCSLALRRWRRLISPRMAVTINCASVSFSSLTKFISLKTSRGILAVFCCDLLLVVPVGITGLLTVRWRSVYVEKKIKKGLKCKSPKSSIIFKGDLHLKDKAPQVSLPLAGLLTTNDNDSIEVAM